MPDTDLTFNTTAGQTVGREMLIAYLNTGESGTPTWSPIGKRVEDSSIGFDWQTETKVDIFGDTYTTARRQPGHRLLTPVSLTALMRRKRKSGTWLSKTMMSMPC